MRICMHWVAEARWQKCPSIRMFGSKLGVLPAFRAFRALPALPAFGPFGSFRTDIYRYLWTLSTFGRKLRHLVEVWSTITIFSRSLSNIGMEFDEFDGI